MPLSPLGCRLAPRWFVLALCLIGQSLAAEQTGPPRSAVASAHPAATRAGIDILAVGGNVFDAAVAVGAALAVVEPYSSGLGGGGFWLLHRAADARALMIDARERAPLAAHRAMYLNDQGQFIPDRALDGPLAAGIPGLPAALIHLSTRYGRLPLAPAIALARDGFVVDRLYREYAAFRRDTLRASPAAAAQSLVDGEPPPPDHLLRQPDLAATLDALVREGRVGFYAGPIAERLVTAVRAGGGIWSADDLRDYQVIERTPISGTYRGWHLVSAAPPSSGGVLLIAMLNMLDTLDAAALSGAERVHALVEVMRRAYRAHAHARALGDPDQVAVPVERLTHPLYAAGLIRDFDPRRATPSRLADLDCDPWTERRPAANQAPPPERHHTTHFSILDRAHGRVEAASDPRGIGSAWVE